MALTKIRQEQGVVINEGSTDVDFRVESNGNANMLFVDGGNDRVGIGTGSPNGTLTVRNGSSSTEQIIVGNTANTGGRDWRLGRDNAATGDFIIKSSDNTNDNVLTERMRIAADGTALFGKAAVNFAVAGVEIHQVGGINITRAATVLNLNRLTSDGETVVFHRNTVDVGSINVTGSGTAYTESSDYRLKENVDYTWDATTRLKQLKPARFNFISDDTNTLIDGFLAHEVSSIVPNAVTGEKDAVYPEGHEKAGEIKTQRMDKSKLIPLLVKTIQELEARITALE